LNTENEKLKQDIAKLQAALEKQKKELHSKAEIYKNKTEQFQTQWRKREEAEKLIKVIIQHVLNYISLVFMLGHEQMLEHLNVHSFI